MGAIQQAFNQALGVAALATAPALADIKHKKQAVAQHEAQVAGAKEVLSQKQEAYQKVGTNISPQEKLAREEDLASAASRVYELEPTEANLRSKMAQEEKAFKQKTAISRHDKMMADAAKKSAERLATTRDQYKDQIAMLHSIAEGVRFGSTQKDKGGAK